MLDGLSDISATCSGWCWASAPRQFARRHLRHVLSLHSGEDECYVAAEVAKWKNFRAQQGKVTVEGSVVIRQRRATHFFSAG